MLDDYQNKYIGNLTCCMRFDVYHLLVKWWVSELNFESVLQLILELQVSKKTIILVKDTSLAVDTNGNKNSLFHDIDRKALRENSDQVFIQKTWHCAKNEVFH